MKCKRKNTIQFVPTKKIEEDIQRRILQFLQSYGIYAWKNKTVGKKGVSDIIGILPDGKFLAIKVKTIVTKNKLTKYQREFLQDIDKNNGISFVAWNVEMVEDILKENRYISKRKWTY